MKPLPVILAAALFVSLALPAPARAHAAKDAASSLTQVDGILGGVVDQLWAQNDTYWHHGDYPRIIALDRIIVEADPHFIDCFQTGAWLMWSDGLDKDAEAFYLQGIRFNPRNTAAYYDYGSFLFHHLHRYDDARRLFQRMVSLPGADVLDWRMLAHSYEKLGQLDRAVATWQKIKTRWPHGAPRDMTHGAVDTNNLNRDRALLAAAPPSPKAVTP